jgi:hypothetical protein
LQLGRGELTSDQPYTEPMPLSSWRRWFDGPSRASEPPPGASAIVDRADAGFWLVLARAPSSTERQRGEPYDEEAFTPDEVRALLSRPGLRLVQPVDERVHGRYDMTPVDIERNPYQTPHMAVRIADTVFTSVIAFLERLP